MFCDFWILVRVELFIETQTNLEKSQILITITSSTAQDSQILSVKKSDLFAKFFV